MELVPQKLTGDEVQQFIDVGCDMIQNFAILYHNELRDKANVRSEVSDDLEKALVSIWQIIRYNLVSFTRNFSDPETLYSVSASTRLIMECVADAGYLCSHSSEARTYWSNQESIREELQKSKNDPWESFRSGKVKTFGKLEGPTDQRVKFTFGADGPLAYNFLCFFCHPNVAGRMWLDNKSGRLPHYHLQLIARFMQKFINLVDEFTPLDLPSSKWLEQIPDPIRIKGLKV